MKTVICFLALAAFAKAVEIETYSVSSRLVDFLEGIRDEMPNGFPSLGIPPLAPLVIDHKLVDINTPTLKVVGTVQNFTAIDLNSYEVLEVQHSAVRRKLSFSLYFRNIEIDTWYDLESYFQQGGWTVKVVGTGKANFAVKGLLLSGTTKYSINILNSKIKLKSLKIVPQIESAVSNIQGVLGNGAINKKWNQELEKAVPTFVNIFGEPIANQCEAIIMPAINKFLDQHSLNDIQNSSGGK